MTFPDGRNVNPRFCCIDDEGHVRGSITAGIDIT